MRLVLSQTQQHYIVLRCGPTISLASAAQHTAAHQACPYSFFTLGGVYLSISVPTLQEVPQSLPQHQMPDVPGDLIPPGVPPQVPTSQDCDPPGVDPQMLALKVIVTSKL